MNIVDVQITTERECDVKDGEYTILILGFVGVLDISAFGGVDDASLIKEAVEESIMTDEVTIKPDESNIFRFQESGEWEDVFWHKYYVLTNKED